MMGKGDEGGPPLPSLQHISLRSVQLCSLHPDWVLRVVGPSCSAQVDWFLFPRTVRKFHWGSNPGPLEEQQCFSSVSFLSSPVSDSNDGFPITLISFQRMTRFYFFGKVESISQENPVSSLPSVNKYSYILPLLFLL